MTMIMMMMMMMMNDDGDDDTVLTSGFTRVSLASISGSDHNAAYLQIFTFIYRLPLCFYATLL